MKYCSITTVLWLLRFCSPDSRKHFDWRKPGNMSHHHDFNCFFSESKNVMQNYHNSAIGDHITAPIPTYLIVQATCIIKKV